MLNPDKFGNIFLGLGGFHLEKVVIACCGKYLEESGIDSIFVELEMFGPEVVTSVMAVGNYIRGKRGIALISEALQRLQFSEFIKAVDISRFSKLFLHIAQLQTLFRTENRTPESIKSAWKCCQNEINELNEAFSLFKDRCSKASERFQYFNIFLERIAPVLRDLTRSYRESNWELHLTALRRALPLCFVSDRGNYKRWLPLYYEDCLALPQTSPMIYSAFLEGDFTVKQTANSGRGVPLDQALEKEYNKSAKGPSGIIRYTRRKESVLKWNIIYHDKRQFTDFLYDICCLDDKSEYPLHHEISDAKTEADEICVSQPENYILQRGNPFNNENQGIQNLATGALLDKKASQFLLNVMLIGESAYAKFRKGRLEEKSVQLFDSISKTRTQSKLSTKKEKNDILKEITAFMRNIDYARLRDYSLTNLLKYEITSTSFYLTKGSFVRKHKKSEFATVIKETFKNECLSEVPMCNVQQKGNASGIFYGLCQESASKKS